MNIEIKLTKSEKIIILIITTIICSFIGVQNKNIFNEGAFVLSFSYKLKPEAYSAHKEKETSDKSPVLD